MPSTVSAARSPGVVASAVAAFGWGLTGIFGTLTYAPGLVVTFYRTWLGAGLLIAYLALSGRRLTWPVVRLALGGGILLAGDMTLFFSAVRLTTVAVATVLGALQPALVLVAAGPAVGERVGRRQIGWTVLAVAGVSVIVAGGGSLHGGRATGDLLAVGSLLCWTAYFVVAKRASPRVEAVGHDAFEYTAGVTLVAAVVASLVMLTVGQSPARIHAQDWIWIGLLAVIPTGSHLLMNWAHRYLDVSVSSVIGSSNPVVAAVGAWIVLGQALDGFQIAGGLVGLVAIGVVARAGGRGGGAPVASPAQAAVAD